MHSCKTRRRTRIAWLAGFLAFLCFAPGGHGLFAQDLWPALPGDRPIHDIQENNDIRKALFDSLLNAAIAQVDKFGSRQINNSWGLWDVSVSRNKDAAYISLVPERNKEFSGYSQGTWIIKRSAANGAFIQAKIFLKSDPGIFARIYPNGSRSTMDIIVFGAVLYKEVPIALPFEEVLRSPFSRIRNLCAPVVDWQLFSPDPALYSELRKLEAAVRKELPSLAYADDAAIDFDGRKVLISTLEEQHEPYGLNCSGFVKWLTDGILYPITGTYLSVDSMKERMIGLRGSSMTINFEEKLDPFFGLDWSRALAKAAWSGFYPSLRNQSLLSNDVNEALFALQLNDAKQSVSDPEYIAYADNFDDAGFDIRGLKAALFLLASREPGRFYLAQFNTRDEAPPRLRRYFHIAALFPYFAEDGTFNVAVFESAEETSLEAVLKRSYEFVKLVKMPSSGSFIPQKL